MSIALGTLFIFLLVIPGIVFHRTLTFGEQTKKASKLSAFDDFVWAIIPGLSIQFLAAAITNFFNPFGYFIDFGSLGEIFFADKSAPKLESIQNHLPVIIVYNLILIILAGVIGYSFRKCISKFHWDRKYKFLRFNNEWHYLLRGEFVYFKDNRFQVPKKFDSCLVYIVTREDSQKRYLYVGTVLNFYLTKEGELDTIWLRAPEKCELKNEGNHDFRPIVSSVLVLKGCEIIDIAVKVISNVEEEIVPEEIDPSSASPASVNDGNVSGSTVPS